MRGRYVLKQYKKNNSLSNQHYKIVTNIVVDSLLTRKERLKCSDFIECAEKIIATFPNERRDIFFIRSNKGRPRGKLIDRYYNVIRKLRKSGLWKRSLRISKTNTTQNQEEYLNPSEGTIEVNQAEKMREKLMLCRDWKDVVHCWNETFNHRMAFNRQSSMMKIYNYWPQYNDNVGMQLIEIDYQCLFPGTSINLFKNWHLYLDKFKYQFMNCAKESPNGVFYNQLMFQKLTDNTRDYSVFMLLHALLPPNCIISNVGNSRMTWRPNIIDSQNSAIVHLRNPNELLKKIEDIKTVSIKYGLPMHPLIVVFGDDKYNCKQSFVYINQRLHKTISFLDAVDLCFKCYKVFHLEYAKESELVWQLIESMFYKFNQATTDAQVRILQSTLVDC